MSKNDLKFFSPCLLYPQIKTDLIESLAVCALRRRGMKNKYVLYRFWLVCIEKYFSSVPKPIRELQSWAIFVDLEKVISYTDL